jgi:prepilin-type N-terminal cleavage/methylation domain-containing protein
MNSPFPTSRSSRSGFTLVEILVSFTILGLIMVGVAQMMSSALSATIGGYKHMDADTQARMVLDRMAFDISKITKRADIDYYFNKATGNDQMAFYTESGGYYPSGATATQDGEVSLVGYMINSSGQLMRLSKGMVWNGVNSSAPAMVFNPLANASGFSLTGNTITNTSWNGTANGIANGSDANYQIIGDQVFRFEYCFLVQSAPTSSTVTTTVGTFYDYPSATSSTTPPNALKDVTAIVVSIAVLDSKSRISVSNTALQTAASNLPDDTFTGSTPPTNTPSTAESKLPLATWKAALASNGLGLPKTAASQVRFYQRFCYLNHLQ